MLAGRPVWRKQLIDVRDTLITNSLVILVCARTALRSANFPKSHGQVSFSRARKHVRHRNFVGGRCRKQYISQGIVFTEGRRFMVWPWNVHQGLQGRPIGQNTYDFLLVFYNGGCSGLVVEHRTRNREVAGSTHTQSTASNLEQVANLLCSGQLSLLPSAGREMSSSYWYGVKA